MATKRHRRSYSAAILFKWGRRARQGGTPGRPEVDQDATIFVTQELVHHDPVEFFDTQASFS
jgi:hypothetical protein